ncbi:MAG: L,D-transpeptidase scaffold domain-containing protein, partial [Methylomonas sp.]
MKTIRYLFPVLALLYFFSPSAFPESSDTVFSQTIKTLLAAQRHPLLLQQDFSRQSQALSQLYAMNANQPIWLGAGRSEKNLADALTVLSDAYTDGLNPAHYDAEPIRRYVQQAISAPQTAVKELASYDLAISISLLRFINDLYAGRVDPHELGYPTQFGSKPAIDGPAVLMQHRQQENLAELPLAVAPKIQQYQRLKRALAGYRELTLTGPRALLSFEKPLSPGKRHPQLPELRRRLHELGELAEAELASIDESETLYDEMTVAAVMRLQQDQGLIADGVIGEQTAELLNQSPAEKVAKIELAMERIRWLPELPSSRFIIVNIPAFELWAFTSPEDQNPLNMKVVVGKAYENQTPMLWEKME